MLVLLTCMVVFARCVLTCHVFVCSLAIDVFCWLAFGLSWMCWLAMLCSLDMLVFASHFAWVCLCLPSMNVFARHVLRVDLS